METTITAVTVYTDRARVTRRGEMMLVAGEQTLSLPNLPMTLEEDSLRVNGRGAGVTILNVEVKTIFTPEPGPTGAAALMGQLDSLQQQDQTLLDEEENYESQIALLDAARDTGAQSFARKIANGRAAVDDLSGYARYIETEQARLRNLKREIVFKRRKLAREIDSMQKQIMIQFSSPGEKKSYTRREVQVRVMAAAAVAFELELVYNVRNASWKPHYDLRLTGNEVELVYMASITQSSEESWENVDLSLSTARPAASSTLPELTPYYLSPPPAAAMPMDAPSGQVAQMSVEQGAALNYRVSTPTTIPSDGAAHKATVTVQKLTAEVDYLSVPKLAEEAYLRARITNTSAYTLLPGLVSIFHGGEFVGRTSIPTIAPNEEFEVQLGVDDRIKVKRELVQRDVGKKLIGSTRQIQFAYKITVANLSPNSALITISDQLPLSANEQIKVNLLNASPVVGQDKLNILTWILRLKPEEKQEITFSYMVEHPADMNVSGLG